MNLFTHLGNILQKLKLDECSNHTACHPHLSVMHECTVISGHLHVCFVTDACTYVVWILFKCDWVSFIVFAFCVCLSQISERTKSCNLKTSEMWGYTVFLLWGCLFFMQHLCYLAEMLGHQQVNYSYRKSLYWNCKIFWYVMSSAWRIDLLMVWKFLAKTCSQFLYDWYSHPRMCKWDLLDCKLSPCSVCCMFSSG